MADLVKAWGETNGTIAERIVALRARKVQMQGVISARDIKHLWGQRMVLAAARVTADDPATPKSLRILCRATYDNLMGDLFTDLDPNDPEQAPVIKAYLDGLQAAGVLSAEVRAETLALGMQEVPEFTPSEADFPALHAAGLITDEEAGLKEG